MHSPLNACTPASMLRLHSAVWQCCWEEHFSSLAQLMVWPMQSLSLSRLPSRICNQQRCKGL